MAIMSWVSQGRSPIEYVLIQLADPLLRPIRRLLPAMGGMPGNRPHYGRWPQHDFTSLKKLRPQSVTSRIQPGSDVIVCAEMDEQWGYVGAKSRQRWLFYAYDRIRRTVVAHVFGERTLATLERLLSLLSAFEVVVWMTDGWPLYESSTVTGYDSFRLLADDSANRLIDHPAIIGLCANLTFGCPGSATFWYGT